MKTGFYDQGTIKALANKYNLSEDEVSVTIAKILENVLSKHLNRPVLVSTIPENGNGPKSVKNNALEGAFKIYEIKTDGNEIISDEVLIRGNIDGLKKHSLVLIENAFQTIRVFRDLLYFKDLSNQIVEGSVTSHYSSDFLYVELQEGKEKILAICRKGDLQPRERNANLAGKSLLFRVSHVEISHFADKPLVFIKVERTSKQFAQGLLKYLLVKFYGTNHRPVIAKCVKKITGRHCLFSSSGYISRRVIKTLQAELGEGVRFICSKD